METKKDKKVTASRKPANGVWMRRAPPSAHELHYTANIILTELCWKKLSNIGEAGMKVFQKSFCLILYQNSCFWRGLTDWTGSEFYPMRPSIGFGRSSDLNSHNRSDARKIPNGGGQTYRPCHTGLVLIFAETGIHIHAFSDVGTSDPS